MKKLPVILLGIFFVLSILAVSNAATLQLDGNKVTGITGFEYREDLYDVTFVYDSFLDIWPNPTGGNPLYWNTGLGSLVSPVTEINSLLQAEANWFYLTIGDSGEQRYRIPGALNNNNSDLVDTGMGFIYYDKYRDEYYWTASIVNSVSANQVEPYAVFTPSAVPM
jgi:hypothetical protein